MKSAVTASTIVAKRIYIATSPNGTSSEQPKMKDGERAAVAIKGIEGKRLTYSRLTKQRTLKQKARTRFVAWRKTKGGTNENQKAWP